MMVGDVWSTLHSSLRETWEVVSQPRLADSHRTPHCDETGREMNQQPYETAPGGARYKCVWTFTPLCFGHESVCMPTSNFLLSLPYVPGSVLVTQNSVMCHKFFLIIRKHLYIRVQHSLIIYTMVVCQVKVGGTKHFVHNRSLGYNNVPKKVQHFVVFVYL